MPKEIKRIPKIVKQSIPQQIKTSANSLTIAEWNLFVNVLKEQGNITADYLEKLHAILFGDYTGASADETIEVPSLPEIKETLATHKIDIKDLLATHKLDIKDLQEVTKSLIADVEYAPSNGHLTFIREDGTSFVKDLPLELIVERGYYEDDTHEIVLVLANGNHINIPLQDILIGLSTPETVEVQINDKLSIIRLDDTPMEEVDLITLMQTLEQGIYRIVTVEAGFELLFISDMLQIVAGQEYEDVPELETRKEYARYTADGSSYKFDTDLQDWVMAAGGGGTGGGTASAPRAVPYPVGRPLAFTHAIGAELSIGFVYQNSLFKDATMIISVNGLNKITKQIVIGRNEFDIASFIQTGVNVVKISIADPEGTTCELVYTITGDTIALSSTFNDVRVTINQDVVIPYKIVGTPTQRLMHFTLDGVETTEFSLTNNDIKIYNGLTHGVHELSMYVEGIFKDGNGIELYRISSNVVRLNIIYDDGVTPHILISSKYSNVTEVQGDLVALDYIVYTPGNEVTHIEMYLDGDLFNSLDVDYTRHYWNIKTMSVGTHELLILAGTTELRRSINITPAEINVEVIKDSFLKLYLMSFGKSNNDVNKAIWANIYGAPVTTTFENVNYISTGWINDALRLVGDANAVIQYKPFATEIPSSGRTIEIDFTTRFTLSEDTVLLSCFDGVIGFVIKTQSAELRSSNTITKTYFKDDEHVKIGFTIDPNSKSIITYINGVTTGVAFFSELTSFRQVTPQNISINPSRGSVDLFSIRVYERALTASQMLNNYMAEIIDTNARIASILFNDVYDNAGNASKEKMGALIPILMLEGSPLPTTKMDSKPGINVYFEHPFEPNKNFTRTDLMTDINAQGTSSLAYPVKNFKIRLDQKRGKKERVPYAIEPGFIPERVFTLKADYMDSSHANNMGLAKLFDTMCSVGIPPHEYDSRVRSSLYGYPVALFHRVNPQDAWVYKGIYNFNLDKDSTDSVGLNNEKNYGTEEAPITFPLNQSFEITFNQDSGAGAFQNNDLGNVVASFEARYPELDEDPVFDAQGNLTVTPELTAHYAKLRELIQWVMDNNNLPSFKTEFETHFDKEFTLKYLIATEIFGLVDNLGKNVMLNTWNGTKWYPNFYDIDTALGLDNAGINKHNYDVEIGDVVNDERVYATTDSWLWANILKYFKAELATYYSELRQGVFSYNNILEFLHTQQISKISEAQYNLDTYTKYISVTTAFLYMAQGKRIEFIKRWLTNRLAMFDSKYIFGEYASDIITLRINIPGYQDAYLDLTPVITQYVGAEFGNVNEYPVQAKTKGGVPVRINGPQTLGTSQITFMEVGIHGAKHLKDIGSISHLYPSLVDTERAPKLSRLIIGNQNASYSNSNLTEVRVGTNTHLEEVDVTNCTRLGTAGGMLDLSQAENIKKVYALGTQITGVRLHPGAPIEILKLPATTTELVLRSHNKLMPEGLIIEDYSNITTFSTDSMPYIDVLKEFNKTTNVQRLRMTGLKYSMYGLQIINDLISRIWDDELNTYKVIGIDANGFTQDTPEIRGEFLIMTTEDISPLAIQRIKDILRNVKITIYRTIDGLTLEDKSTYYNISAYNGNANAIRLPDMHNPLLSVFNNSILGLAGWKPVESIGAAVFKNKTFSEISIPKSIKFIGTEAFSGANNFEIINIPIGVTNIGQSAFALNKEGVTIIVEAETLPATWHAQWNINVGADVRFGGLPIKTFTFSTNGGTSIDNVVASYLTEALMPVSYKYGYNVSSYTSLFNPITFPYIPVTSSEDIIPIELQWTPWVYTINYRLDDNSIYTTQTIDYNTPLGAEFELIDKGGSNAPTSSGKSLDGWIDTNYTEITPETVITQEETTINFYVKWLDTNGLIFTYNSTEKVYDVTAWSPSSASMVGRSDSSLDLFIPGTFDDNINGEKPVRHIQILNGNLSYKRTIRSINIEQSSRNDRVFGITNNTTTARATAEYPNVTTVVLPEGFVEIARWAFCKYSKLTNISLPNSLLKIGALPSISSAGYEPYGAFQHCTSLTNIIIPAGVTYIGDFSFGNCTSLNTATIPDTITTIGTSAFAGCTSLSTINFNMINIPLSFVNYGQFATGGATTFNFNFLQNSIKLTSDKKGIMNISENVLYCYTENSANTINIADISPNINELSSYCFAYSSLTEIIISPSVTKIGGATFTHCSKLTSLYIPDTVTDMPKYSAGQSDNSIWLEEMWRGLFSECTSLTTVRLPNSTTTIQTFMFYNCTSLSTVELPNTIVNIKSYGFYNSGVTSIVIPDSVTTLGTDIFKYCKLLTSVILPSGLTTIPTAFCAEAAALTSITIPASVTSISYTAFNRCYALNSVILLPVTPPSLGNYQVFDGNAAGRKFYIPTGTYATYSTATNWSYYKTYMEEVA